MSLSEEQKKKIEENRLRALALRANKQQTVSNISSSNVLISPKAPSSFATSTGTSNPSAANQSKTNTFPPATAKPSAFTSTTGSQSKINFFSTKEKNPDTSRQTSKNFAKDKDKKVQSLPTSFSTGANSVGQTKKQREFFLGKDVAVTAKCVLLSRTRFAIDAKFFTPLIELFKTMSTRQYDVQKKQWSFDLQDYKTLLTEIREKLGKAVTVEELPKSVVRALMSSSDQSIPEANLSEVDEKLVGTLLPFQREGVNYAIHHNGRVLVADDMGLGKTIQALCIASYYRHEWPLLIVVPSTVRFTWQQQILEWLPSSVQPQQINVVLSSRDNCTSGLINIVSYDLMVKFHSELLQKNFKVVVMDESHFLKNSKTTRTKKAVPLLKKATRVILLSGTPAMSRPAELYTQLAAVDPRLFPQFHEYGVRYCDGKQMPWGWDFSGSSNKGELQTVLEEKIMIRRLKKDVLHQLPSKYRTMIVLDPGSVAVNKTMKVSHDMVNKMKGMERRGALLEYFHTTGEAKIKAVKEYVLDLLESEHKFLLFAHHRSMLDAIEESVQSKFKYIRIDGRTNPEQRNFFCDRFQENDDVRLAILSITAANAGINLTAASLVVFAELFWNPGILAQAEDRVHRIGQQDSVNIQYLVARNTADDYIWPMIQHKLAVLSEAGLSKDDYDETETKHLQDPKQKDILQYFNEDLLPEDDIFNESSADRTSVTTTVHPNASSSSDIATKTLFQYFKASDTAEDSTKTDQESMCDSAESDATVDWAEGMDDILDNINDDFELEEPLAKKSKVS